MIAGSKAKVEKLESLLARVLANTERRPAAPQPTDDTVITALVHDASLPAKQAESRVDRAPAHADQVTAVAIESPAAAAMRGDLDTPADDAANDFEQDGVLEILGEADATLGDDTLEIIATADATDAIDELVVVTGESEFDAPAIDLPQTQDDFAPLDAPAPPTTLAAEVNVASLDDLTMEMPLESDFAATPKTSEKVVVAAIEIQHVSMPIEPVAAPELSIAFDQDKSDSDALTLEMPLETREAPAFEPTREAHAFEPTREAKAFELPAEAHLPEDKTLAEPEISLESATPSLDDEPAPESGPQLVGAPAQSDRMPVAAPIEPPAASPDLSTARMQVSELETSAKTAVHAAATRPEPVVIAPDSPPKAVAQFMGVTKDFHPETIAALIDAALDL
jgi:hypothetical protein